MRAGQGKILSLLRRNNRHGERILETSWFVFDYRNFNYLPVILIDYINTVFNSVKNLVIIKKRWLSNKRFKNNQEFLSFNNLFSNYLLFRRFIKMIL